MQAKKVSKRTPKNPLDYQVCIKCKEEKKLSSDYYSVTSDLYGDAKKYPVCKECLTKKIPNETDPLNNVYLEIIKSFLLELNKPFLYDLWLSSIEEANRRKWSTFNAYMKNIQLGRNKELSWKDSVFEKSDKVFDIRQSNIDELESNQFSFKKENYNLNQLKSKYGYGYPDDEYYLFEDKYQQLKTSFQLLTTMHEEYFREFCVNKVKETLAKAKGNFKEAKEWAAMVKDVAEAGKLKPSQMSKADLSGGLDTFGQLARMVEENHEIMPLLPHFTEQPKDKVDVTLWCFINYVRDLKGLPECEYKEIYAFYDKKKQDYESQMSDNSFDHEEDDANG